MGTAEVTEASLGNVQDLEPGCVEPGKGGERKNVQDRKRPAGAWEKMA